ncbi:LuxR family transcriptional regulator [Actinomadura sp. WAC 06369]|nr:LuxR family transcriptional regulator [Actinomadura sp. WAC 06369]
MRGRCDTAARLRRSMQAWQDGRVEAAVRHGAEAAVAECEGGHELCRLAQFRYATLLIKVGELESGRRALEALEADGAGTESPTLAAASHVARGTLHFALGTVNDAIAELEMGLRIAERHGVRSLRTPCYTVIALCALRRADMRVCLDFVDKLADEALLGYCGHAAGAWVTAQAMEARSGVASAGDLISGIVTSPHVLRPLMVSEPAAAAWLVRAFGKLDAPDLARKTVSAVSAAAADNSRFGALRGAALHAAGLLESDSGKLWEAAGLYPDRWSRASALEDMAAVVSERCCEKERTVRTLESVLSVYEATGARRDAARVVSKLRDFGVRRGAIRTVNCPDLLPHGLTKTEFAVAELVSQGHTNDEVGRQLFISRHTVAFHLKKVFQKMNVASRVELAAVWTVNP